MILEIIGLIVGIVSYYLFMQFTTKALIESKLPILHMLVAMFLPIVFLLAVAIINPQKLMISAICSLSSLLICAFIKFAQTTLNENKQKNR